MGLFDSKIEVHCIVDSVKNAEFEALVKKTDELKVALERLINTIENNKPAWAEDVAKQIGDAEKEIEHIIQTTSTT